MTDIPNPNDVEGDEGDDQYETPAAYYRRRLDELHALCLDGRAEEAAEMAREDARALLEALQAARRARR